MEISEIAKIYEDAILQVNVAYDHLRTTDPAVDGEFDRMYTRLKNLLAEASDVLLDVQDHDRRTEAAKVEAVRGMTNDGHVAYEKLAAFGVVARVYLEVLAGHLQINLDSYPTNARRVRVLAPRAWVHVQQAERLEA